jgi:hypothetical protein
MAVKQSKACNCLLHIGLRYTFGVLCRLVFNAMLLFFCFAKKQSKANLGVYLGVYLVFRLRLNIRLNTK